MKKVTIKIYTIRELSQKSRSFAVSDHRDFMLSVYRDDDWDESIGMTYSKYEKTLRNKDLIENIEANEYLFFANGELANATLYCGNHLRAGDNVFTFMGEEILLDT